MTDATIRLEIDVMQANELQTAIDLACKHQMPAMVIHQQLVSEAVMMRIRRKGRFKIIVPIDWPKGENFSMLKMRGLTKQALAAEGFEILLTGGKSEAETHNEAVALSEFVSQNISSASEVRFVLGAQMRTEDETLKMCRGLVGVRQPTYIRVDHHLKVQVTKGSHEAQAALAARIKEVIGFPLKACGNYTTAKSVASCPWASRVAVSLTQAQQIIKDLSRQPDGLRDMLT
jgi:4-hydroxy-3-methylbut-2-en-1-yl diphosphate synthase IspG/GcpE